MTIEEAREIHRAWSKRSASTETLSEAAARTGYTRDQLMYVLQINGDLVREDRIPVIVAKGLSYLPPSLQGEYFELSKSMDPHEFLPTCMAKANELKKGTK